jgi:regulator of nonsense transcripts 2
LLTESKQDVEEDSDSESTFDEEAIVVTRQEEEVDPEDEADFEREYAKMMAESLESRKFERKQLFDVPLPVRAKTREATSTEGGEGESPPGHTMAFSLLTKKGNRQQVLIFDLVP